MDKAIIDKIKEAASVAEVVGDFLNLKTRGANMIGLCPFHNEKTPSFTVFPAKNTYRCFGCGKGGDAIEFVKEYEKVTYPEALRYLAAKYNIEVPDERKKTPVEIQAEQRTEAAALALTFAEGVFIENLNSDIGKSVAVQYFKERGFNYGTIATFKLGYDDGRLPNVAKSKGYNLEILRLAGLINSADKGFFANRVIFPIHNIMGKVVGFGGRIMTNDKKQPKYLNSPETEIYRKSKVLYGLFQSKNAIRKQDRAILVEGYTDVISLHQAGIENVVSASGTALSKEQLLLIKRFTPNITLLFDADSAGDKATLKSIELALSLDMNISVAVMPKGEDPDSIVRSKGLTAMQGILERKKDVIVWLAERIGLMQEAFEKAEATRQVLRFLNACDALRREIYLAQIARLLGLTLSVLKSELKQIKDKTTPKPTEPKPTEPKTEASERPLFADLKDEDGYTFAEIEEALAKLNQMFENAADAGDLQKMLSIEQKLNKVYQKKEMLLTANGVSLYF